MKYAVLRKMRMEFNRFQTISILDVNVELLRLAHRKDKLRLENDRESRQTEMADIVYSATSFRASD